MATISQQPASLALTGVIGSPFSLLVNFVSFTGTGGSVSWASVTSPVVIVTDQYGNNVPSGSPSIDNPPDDYTLLIGWTAQQTAIISNAQGTRWALQITVNDVGPETILAGSLTFVAPTWPGASTSTTAALSVTAGTSTANIEVSAATANPVILNLDGGNAASDYLPTQIIDGGDA